MKTQDGSGKISLLTLGLALLTLTLAGHTPGLAQAPTISALAGNGILTWTNAVQPDARYAIEWAASLDGPWLRTWQSLAAIEARTNTAFTAAVPMFYRVAMTSAPWPSGMVLVDSGEFEMGDHYNVGDTDEEPVHRVFVSAFYMDRYLVTNERMRRILQWAYDRGLVTATSATVKNAEGAAQELLDLDDPDVQLSFADGQFRVLGGKDNFPCVEVTWHGALAYANFRSDREGLPRAIDFATWNCDFSAPGYRLPTEAEWEKAARGGLVGHYFPWPSLGGNFASHINGSMANYADSGDPYDSEPTVRTTPVGYYNGGQIPGGDDQANPLGLYDMAGNVRQWCWDWYQAGWYQQAGATLPDTAGPATGSMRVHRAGMYNHDPVNLRCANRAAEDPATSPGYAGFRCARR